MDAWTAKALEIVHFLFRQPGSVVETVSLGVIGVIVMINAFRWAGHAAGMPDVGGIRRTLGFLLALVVTFGATVAGALYLVPLVESAAARQAVLVGIPVLVLLCVVLPASKPLLRCRYVSGLIGYVSATVVGLLVIVVLSLLVDAVQTGGRQSKGLKKGGEAVNEVLGD